MSWPLGVCPTSGWNCTPASPRSGASNAATGAPGELAVTVNPGGAALTASPWLIHTDGAAGRSRRMTPRSPLSRSGVPPNSRRPVCATSPPRARAIAWKP
jgi:hypothetical protein